ALVKVGDDRGSLRQDFIQPEIKQGAKTHSTKAAVANQTISAPLEELPNFGFNQPKPPPPKANLTQTPQSTSSGSKTWDGFIEFCDAKAPAVGVILESVVESILPTFDSPHLKLGFRE